MISFKENVEIFFFFFSFFVAEKKNKRNIGKYSKTIIVLNQYPFWEVSQSP